MVITEEIPGTIIWVIRKWGWRMNEGVIILLQWFANTHCLGPLLMTSAKSIIALEWSPISALKTLCIKWNSNNPYFIGLLWELNWIIMKITGNISFRKYLLLLLSRFSRVRLCAIPETAAHQAPPSLGFSRQEYWSGLPFPSPMHESEKWKWSRSVVSDS